jgi:hypothetical protein
MLPEEDDQYGNLFIGLIIGVWIAVFFLWCATGGR